MPSATAKGPDLIEASTLKFGFTAVQLGLITPGSLGDLAARAEHVGLIAVGATLIAARAFMVGVIKVFGVAQGNAGLRAGAGVVPADEVGGVLHVSAPRKHAASLVAVFAPHRVLCLGIALG